MKQVKTLRIVVVALILLNLAFLTFHFTRNRQHPRGPESMREMIIENLNFSKTQIEDYDELINVHKTNVQRLVKEKTQTKQKLYRLLDGKNEHETGQPELIAHLGGIQVELEAVHYEHFNRLRQLCKEDQVDEFEKLQQKLVHLFSPKPPRKGKR